MTKLAIGITGRAQRGKTTTAKILMGLSSMAGTPVQLVSFADPIKDFLTAVIGRSEPFRGNEQDRNAPIPEITWGDCSDLFRTHAIHLLGREVVLTDNPTGRQLMQLFGSEVVRQGFMADVWVRMTKTKCDKFDGLSCVDDARFENECRIFDHVLKITREGYPMSTHASEVAVDLIPMDRFSAVFSNDGSTEALVEKVQEWFADVHQTYEGARHD